MSATDSDFSYHRKAILLIAAAFLFRALYSLFYRVQLAGDEAYYWEWGRHPALGYYSKPAFIAWIYAVVNWIAEGSLFAIRLTAILFGTLSLIVTYLLTRKLFDTRTGFYAVILALAVPGNCLLNLVLTIDAPLVLAWSLSLYFLWKFSTGERPGLSLFLLFVALVIGHLSKQMMLFFTPLAIAYLASGKETRPLLKQPGIWLSLIGSYVGWIPLLYWNSQNGWITFDHMNSHIGAHAEPTIWETLYERIETFLEFFLSQLGAVSPVIAVLIFILTIMSMFQKRQIPRNLRFLIIFCGVPLLMILVAAFFQKIQPNWPAVLYLAGIPMVAAWFTKAVDWYSVSDRTRTNLFRIGISLGFALCAFFYFGPIVFSVTGNEGHTADPNRRLIGSARLGKAVHEVRQTVPGWEDHIVLASGHRYQTGWLGFTLPDHPRVYRIAGSRIESQYEIWPGPWDDGQKGKDAFFVAAGDRKSAGANFDAAFEKVERLKTIQVKFGSGMRNYTIFRCINLKGPLRPPIEKSS